VLVRRLALAHVPDRVYPGAPISVLDAVPLAMGVQVLVRVLATQAVLTDALAALVPVPVVAPGALVAPVPVAAPAPVALVPVRGIAPVAALVAAPGVLVPAPVPVTMLVHPRLHLRR